MWCGWPEGVAGYFIMIQFFVLATLSGAKVSLGALYRNGNPPGRGNVAPS